MRKGLVTGCCQGETRHMNPAFVAVAVVVAAVLLVLVVLTAIGQRRRGTGVVLSLAGGLVFPIAWVVWYLKDQRPYRALPSV